MFISKVGLLGELGDSYVDLTKGLNVISGASNTGKSIIVESIDYALGDKETNIDLHGYDSIYVVISNDDGEVKITRKIGEKKVTIDSNNKNVKSGIYPIKKKANSSPDDRYLDDWLLILMGLQPRLDIVVSKDWKTQNFTFRTCLNSFIVKQEDIIRRESPYLPLDHFSQSAYKSGLLYLWSGERYVTDSNKEGDQIRRARRNAVQMYLTEQITKISERQKQLIDVGLSNKEIENKINELLDAINDNKRILDEHFDEIAQIKDKIIELDEQISESNNLLIKYEALQTQYKADLSRLNLVIEGQVHSNETNPTMTCPFCNGTLEKSVEDNCIEASKKEIEKLIPKMRDLEDVISEVNEEIGLLNEQKEKYSIRRKILLDEINKVIKPLLGDLKTDLQTYKQAIEDSKESSLLAIQKEEYQRKYDELALNQKEEKESKFVVLDYYPPIVDTLEKEYERLLRIANYNITEKPVLSLASDSSFEFSVNGKTNRSQGQGFRGYLHALASLALYNSLRDHGYMQFPFLVMDSPIQNLVETQEQEVTTTMKYGLFNALNEVGDDSQIIVAENKFPTNINYGNANMITFTKDPKTGRYGYAKGITD